MFTPPATSQRLLSARLVRFVLHFVGPHSLSEELAARSHKCAEALHFSLERLDLLLGGACVFVQMFEDGLAPTSLLRAAQSQKATVGVYVIPNDLLEELSRLQKLRSKRAPLQQRHPEIPSDASSVAPQSVEERQALP